MSSSDVLLPSLTVPTLQRPSPVLRVKLRRRRRRKQTRPRGLCQKFLMGDEAHAEVARSRQEKEAKAKKDEEKRACQVEKEETERLR